MHTNQSESKKVKVEVIEAELVDPNENAIDDDGIGAIPRRTAETLDAFADVVDAFVPARAEDLRRKAAAVRTFAKSAERAADAGGGLVASVQKVAKKAAQKLEENGVKVRFGENRRAGVRR
jgi:hypothetical protein